MGKCLLGCSGPDQPFFMSGRQSIQTNGITTIYEVTEKLLRTFDIEFGGSGGGSCNFLLRAESADRRHRRMASINDKISMDDVFLRKRTDNYRSNTHNSNIRKGITPSVEQSIPLAIRHMVPKRIRVPSYYTACPGRDAFSLRPATTQSGATSCATYRGRQTTPTSWCDQRH